MDATICRDTPGKHDCNEMNKVNHHNYFSSSCPVLIDARKFSSGHAAGQSAAVAPASIKYIGGEYVRGACH